jgi:hypothetical protein
MEIEISGHSGCKIEVKRENRSLYVYKSTDDPGYVGRLARQAQKQQQFTPFETSKIKVPEIFHVRSDETVCEIKMAYIYSLNFMAFMENAGFQQINDFIDTISAFVDSEIRESEMQQIDPQIVKIKYRDVSTAICSNPDLADDTQIQSWFPVLDKLFTIDKDLTLPVGNCHGDLTLSNILFTGHHCYLIDFLDSFIETPLMDIIKLRQDTAFGWSGLMYGGRFDSVRQDIALAYMDQKIHQCFSKHPWYQEAYDIFQVMNFLRILPYAHDPKVIDFLKQTIGKML